MSATTQAPPAACYYILNGAYRGPVSEEELAALHAAGTLGDDAQVRTPLAPDWVACREWRAARDRPAPPAPSPSPSATKGDAAAADAGTGPRHSCTGCQKDWPESLMLMNDRRWHCRPCFYNQAMKAKRQREKVRRNWWKWLREHWKGATTLLLTLTAAAFLAWHYRHHLPFDFFDDEDPAEPWAKLPPAQWPQLVFTNRADFNRHSTLRGHGIFFARRGDGAVVAATAAHLLTADAGVVPDMAPSELESSLRSWWAYPPAAPDRAVAIVGLYGPPAALRGFDMLFLRVAPDANTTVTTPLRLSRREARAGEKVFVVSPVLDPKATGPRQAVYPGWIHVKASAPAKPGATAPTREGTLLDVHMDPALVPKDLDGSPVIDERGHLLGLVKGWGDPQDAAGHVNTIVAQGAAAFRELLEPKEQPGGRSKAEIQAAAAKEEKITKALLNK